LGNFEFQGRHLVFQHRCIFRQHRGFLGLVHRSYHLLLQYSDPTLKVCDSVDIFSSRFRIF
jgi:hypothetical protein